MVSVLSFLCFIKRGCPSLTKVIEDTEDFIKGEAYDLLLLGGSVGGPTSEKNQNSVAFNPILLNNITF